MRKHLRILLAAAAVSAIASVAYATSPSFHFANAFFDLNNPDQLDVSFKETGLGNTGFSSVDITVTADATVTCQCVNSGGNCPKAANKSTTSAPVSGVGSFPVRNGQTTGTISVSPPACLQPKPSCTPQQTLEVEDVSYTNIKIADLTVNDGPIPTTPKNNTRSVDISRDSIPRNIFCQRKPFEWLPFGSARRDPSALMIC